MCSKVYIQDLEWFHEFVLLVLYDRRTLGALFEMMIKPLPASRCWVVLLHVLTQSRPP